MRTLIILILFSFITFNTISKSEETTSTVITPEQQQQITQAANQFAFVILNVMQQVLPKVIEQAKTDLQQTINEQNKN
jgi:hypothetical protein